MHVVERPCVVQDGASISAEQNSQPRKYEEVEVLVREFHVVDGRMLSATMARVDSRILGNYHCLSLQVVMKRHGERR